MFGIDLIAGSKEIDGSREILGVDVGRYHVAGFASALSGIRGVESKGQKTALGHCLGIKSGSLFLDSPERTANGDGWQFSGGIFRYIHISRQCDTVTVGECYLAVDYFVALREGLVPFGG